MNINNDLSDNLNSNLKSEINNLLKSMSSYNVKSHLLNKGYSELEIDSILKEISTKQNNIFKKNVNIVLFKDLFDKIGYGFASPLLMYLLLFSMNTPLFFIGIVAAMKNFFTLFMSSYVKEKNNYLGINKKIIVTFGVLFGFSFLLMAFAKNINNYYLFGFAIVLSSIFIVIHGDTYSVYILKKLTKVKSTFLAKLLSYFGLLITAGSLILAGYIFDEKEIIFSWGFKSISVPGFLFELELVALAFIVSSYLFSFVKSYNLNNYNADKKYFFKNHVNKLKKEFSNFIKDSNIKLLFLGGLFIGSFQTVISTFAGIKIYSDLINAGVSNPIFYVAIIFAIGVLVASISPKIVRNFIKTFGETPMLVFGVLLITIFPLAIYFNVNYYGLIMSQIIAVFGASALAITQTGLIFRTLKQDQRKTYFSITTPIISIILPLIVLGFSIFAHFFNLQKMFGLLIILTLIFVIPIYFILVMRSHKKHNSANLY